MARRTDLLIDTPNRTLMVRHGDFLLGHSADQDIELCLLAQPGDWRQWPANGIGLHRYLKGEDGVPTANALAGEITRQLTANGLDSVFVSGNSLATLTIDYTEPILP